MITISEKEKIHISEELKPFKNNEDKIEVLVHFIEFTDNHNDYLYEIFTEDILQRIWESHNSQIPPEKDWFPVIHFYSETRIPNIPIAYDLTYKNPDFDPHKFVKAYLRKSDNDSAFYVYNAEPDTIFENATLEYICDIEDPRLTQMQKDWANMKFDDTI